MSSNGSTASSDAFAWNFGFISEAGKYLTCEKFGGAMNASGQSLKAKQVWTLEQVSAAADQIYIKSSRKTYVNVEKGGSVKCDKDEPEETCRFTVEYNKQGQWAFKNLQFGDYLGSSAQNVDCSSRKPVWWHIQLAIHPQVNMLNTNRKRFCHLEVPKDPEESAKEVLGTQIVPWGAEAMLTLDYIDHQYAIRVSDGRYLTPDGSLQASHEGALYTIQVNSGGLAFRAQDERFLTNIGSTGTLKARNTKVSKDEVYWIKDSEPQITLTGSNGKRASIMQGIDVSANQDDDEIGEKDIFQIEFDNASKKWKFLASNGKYWTLQGTGVQANGEGSDLSPKKSVTKGCEASLFDVEQMENSRVCLKAPNGKYVTIKMTGALTASADTCSDKETFKMAILNRPIIILKGEFGFLGLRNNKIESNRPSYDAFKLSQGDDGLYRMEGLNEKFWLIDNDQVMCNADKAQATGFQLQLLGNSKVALKAPNGNYLRGENNGVLSATGTEVKADTAYEF